MGFLEDLCSNLGYALMVVTFTSLSQILLVIATPAGHSHWSVLGNRFSWSVVAGAFAWALLSLKVVGKTYAGPATGFGYVPLYKANGLQYFLFTVSAYAAFLYRDPAVALDILHGFPEVIATCNICALVLCVFLVFKGKNFPEARERLPRRSLMYEFYVGTELHPRIIGADVKQLTNSRFGLMAWGTLVMTFYVSGWLKSGFNLGFLFTLILQLIYLAKFYWWETGYFSTLDITLDRAGYYICWGCIVWVPIVYTFASYCMAYRPPQIGSTFAWCIFAFGFISIILNYWSDYQKQVFREKNGKCFIWGKPASYITAFYKTDKGVAKKSLLLTSGFWGLSRHMNYLFEIFVALSWSFPAIGTGFWPFLYPVFIVILLVHRSFRDDRKCKEKYGESWTVYCQRVPYRIVPYVF